MLLLNLKLIFSANYAAPSAVKSFGRGLVGPALSANMRSN